MLTDRPAHHRWRPAAALDGVSARLNEVAARAPAAVVLALVALILALVFAPGAGATGWSRRQAIAISEVQSFDRAGRATGSRLPA